MGTYFGVAIQPGKLYIIYLQRHTNGIVHYTI